MEQPFGWTGKILRVDLSSGQTSTIDTMRYGPQFIGGVGIAARIAWEELRPGVGPFDPENLLFIMAGPLTGTLASGAGRVEVLGIAPQQRPSIFSRSGMGGHWGAELKYAGYDGIIVEGKAQKPVYLWIADGQVEIRDASGLWGLGTFTTTRALRVQHGPATRVISCGPAGERLSRIAVIQTETGNAAGQGGFGAVMGAKNLKAIAVRGTMGVRVARPQEFMNLCLRASREGQRPLELRAHGAADAAQVRARWQEKGSRLRKCGFCVTPCTNEIVVNSQAADGTEAPSVARHCWSYMAPPRVDAVARSLTSDYGLNGWDITYGMIPWLQLCKQHGLIDKIDGVDIPVPEKPIEYLKDVARPSEEFLLTLVRCIAQRKGEVGDALADGTCYAAYRLFDGAGVPLLAHIYPRHCGQTEHWAGHWGPGGRVRFPWWLPPVLQWCIDTRDPANDSTHQWTEHVLPYLPWPANSFDRVGPMSVEQVRHVCTRVYGNPDVCDPSYSYDRPELQVIPSLFHSYRGMIVCSLVLCDREHTRVFSTLSEDGAADTAVMSKLFSACTGYEMSEKELDLAGERIWNQLRAIDVRNFGRNRAIDESTLDGLAHPDVMEQIVLDREKAQKLLDKYYEMSGWDPATGRPLRARLEALGLGDVAGELESQ